MAIYDRSDAIALTPEQVAFLFAAKAWWQEGELRLEYLAERTRHQDILAQATLARDRFRNGTEPTAAAVRPFLQLARTLAPNVALNRNRETDSFARALHDLLFAEGPIADRLTAFLQSVRGVGALTASQLLFVAYPDRYPFVRRETLTSLPMTRDQRRVVRRLGRELYGETISTDATSLLAHFVWLSAIRNAAKLTDFADLDAVLRHAREMPPVSPRKKRSASTNRVRESSTSYSAQQTVEPTEAELLRYLESSATAQHLTYPLLMIRNYYLCQKTKPFVILAGLSGTGKTRLTEFFAECLTGQPRAQFRLLPVRPDWSDPSPLLGYHNAITGRYMGTPFLELLQDAGRPENRNRAYFVTLDEMNLARTEHYLADILSAMETRSRDIPLAGTFDAVTLPTNLYLTGTVNMEDGTHRFGQKVLDRANVIEFHEVLFAPSPHESRPIALPDFAPTDRERLFLACRFESLTDVEASLNLLSPSFLTTFYDTLNSLSELVTPRGFAFGYRFRDESLRYIANSFSAEGTPLLIDGADAVANFQTALDLQLCQKLLPRLAGTQERLSRFLKTFATWSDQHQFPRTTQKLERIICRADEDGLVSFWE